MLPALPRNPMRLTEIQRQTVKRLAAEIFGADAHVRLFGSRVDDAKRGGDYDFLLETALDDADALIDRKIRLLAALHATPAFEDEKIDIVLMTPLSPRL